MLLGTPVFVGCSGPSVRELQALRAAEDERVEQAVDARLRSLFPEVSGEISRRAILEALLECEPVPTAETGVPLAAIAAIRVGDWDLARGLLGELVTEGEVARARELAAKGDPRGAVAVLDHAVATAPDSAELRLLRGDAELAVALAHGDRAYAERALLDYRQAAERHGGPRASLGAARAALSLEKNDEAFAQAREGLEALAGRDLRLPHGPTAERVLADAALAAGAPADEARSALFASIARAPEDAWGWSRLAELELERGAAERSRFVARHALALFPDEPALVDALAAALDRSAGKAGVIREFERLTAESPENAGALWKLGHARLEAALDALGARTADPALFVAAEHDFVRCRAAGAPRSPACADEIALARTGLGWARLERGDRDGARDAFLSVEDAKPGALGLDHAPRMASGLAGLAAVGERYVELARTSGAPSLEALEKAARVFDYLHAYTPANALFAAQAARTNRNAAVALEIDARTRDSESARSEAAMTLRRARESMERALACYRSTLESAPDDPRVLFEAGQVLTEYLQRDPDTARAWLARAAKLLEAHRATLPGASASASKDELRELEETESRLSDTYRCLGVLEATLVGDLAAATRWFETCLATGPDPSEDVRGPKGWLARCKEALEHQRDLRPGESQRWAATVR